MVEHSDTHRSRDTKAVRGNRECSRLLDELNGFLDVWKRQNGETTCGSATIGDAVYRSEEDCTLHRTIAHSSLFCIAKQTSP